MRSHISEMLCMDGHMTSLDDHPQELSNFTVRKRAHLENTCIKNICLESRSSGRWLEKNHFTTDYTTWRYIIFIRFAVALSHFAACPLYIDVYLFVNIGISCNRTKRNMKEDVSEQNRIHITTYVT